MTGMPTLSARAKAVDPNRDIRVNRAREYPEQIWIFIASFLALITVFHVGALFISWRWKRQARRAAPQIEAEKVVHNGEAAGSTLHKKISLRHVPLAIVNSFRILACRITVPVGAGSVLNGAEVGIIAGYIITLFTWEFINCKNVVTGTKLDVQYWSNRAGNIVASQLVVMVALAGKNNIVSLLTGISYEKINVLHRAAARVCLVLVWVHFWGRVKIGLNADTAISHPWVRTGITIATAYTTLVLISFRPLRTKFYEFFFFSHCILVLIILIGAYFHMRGGFGATSRLGNYGYYLIPAWALWMIDRFLRLARTLRNNWSYSQDATVELLSPTMVRLVLTRNMTWSPGQSAFLTMPGISRVPFEAHPFTIASIPRNKNLNVTDSSHKGEKQAEKMGGNELVFLIQAREGFTRRLRAAAGCKGVEGNRFPLSVYVDGPYGSPPDLNAYETVILLVGGSGVTYALPLLQDIVRNARRGATGCRSVLFLWAVPHRSSLSWISQDLQETLEAAPQSLRVRLRVHVTQNTSENNDSISGGSSDTKGRIDFAMGRLLQDDCMHLEAGRPNIQTLLAEELADSTGPVSVDVAGPAALAQDVRKALRSDIARPKTVLRGGPDVTLHVETYGIA